MIRDPERLLGAAILLLGLWVSPAVRADPANHTALWWNPAESGWGINVVHQGDIAFASLFTYDESGQPLWLVMSRGERQGSADAFSGPLYRTTGPAFNAVPFTPIGAANVVPVGTMRLQFSGADSATLDYDVGGAQVTKSLTRFVYGARAAECRFVQGSRADAANYQDLWWNAAESGWGINIVHQGDVLFASLFTYGANNGPLWLVMSAGARQADGSYLGDLHRGTGAPFNAQTFTAATLIRVGTMRLRFANGESGTVEYTVDGAAVSKSIARQVFASPATVCSAAPPSADFADRVVYSSAPNASLAGAQELAAISRGQVVVAGATIDYVATTGHLTARGLGTGTPQASFFYVAYTAEGREPSTRPVTFFYNGGPGSSTTFLHMGSFGPRRLATGVPNVVSTGTFPLVDNAESLLDVSDLVFVDAVGTGFSQAIAPFTNNSFWGVDTDAAAFRDFVRRYVEANGRGASPKYLFGESYGTARSAVLARLLESAGVTLSGVILQSSVLNYNSNCGIGDVSCAGYVPTYAAAGAWFGLATPSPDAAGLPGFLARARELATDRYDPAVRAYLATGAAPDPQLLGELSRTTGLAAADWQSHFNLEPDYFQSRLLTGLLMGRYDMRITAPFGSPLARDGDPFDTAISPGFASGIRGYLFGDLGYSAPSAYVVSSNAIATWNFSHAGNRLPDTIPDLAAALALNPRLRVLSLSGYHDLATPFHQTERDLARLGANPNVVIRNYVGGHMTYLDDATRTTQKADLAAFYGSPVTSLVTKSSPVARGLRRALDANVPMPVMEVPLRDPWVPPSAREGAALDLRDF